MQLNSQVASAMEMDHFLPPIHNALQRYTQHIIFIEDWQCWRMVGPTHPFVFLIRTREPKEKAEGRARARPHLDAAIDD